MLVMGRLYLNKYIETLFLSFICLLNHADVTRHLEYLLLARAVILN